MSVLTIFIQKAIVQGICILYGALGEIMTEKSGNLNLGIPGIMYMGGIAGLMGAFLYEKDNPNPNAFIGVLISFVCAFACAMIGGLIYSILTITLRVNQNVTGLALTTFGIGVGNFFGGSLATITKSETASVALTQTSEFFRTALPFASKLGWFGEVFLSYGFLAYLAIVIALLTALFFKHTRRGLYLRAVGENPATADAAGINVELYKYTATCLGSVIAGLGGLYYVMDYTMGVWSNNGFGDRGWLAIALVIFAVWKPDVGVLGSILFGGLYIVYNFIPGLSRSATELFKMLPYVVTIIVLIIISIRRKRENQPPASLGLSYFREER